MKSTQTKIIYESKGKARVTDIKRLLLNSYNIKK